MAGTVSARTAKAGLDLSGSPMAVMIDNLTQMELDKSIGNYNLEVQKRYALSTADAYKRQGKAAMTSAMSNAFSTVLKGGFDYGMKSGMFGGTGTTLQKSDSAMIRNLNGTVSRVPVRSYTF
jgi:hypothetical protein